MPEIKDDGVDYSDDDSIDDDDEVASEAFDTKNR